MHGGYHDIDACPTLTLLTEGADDPVLGEFLQLAVAHRPPEELYDIRSDPDCLKNLADAGEHESLLVDLRVRLENFLRKMGDPRILDGGEVFETYKRYSRIRKFPKPDWAE